MGAISLHAAIEYLQTIGLEQIHAYELLLTYKIYELLGEFSNLHVLGNPDNIYGVVSFYLGGVHHFDIGALLDSQGIAVRTGNHCAQPLLEHFGVDGIVRVSPAFYNTEAELLSFQKGLIKALQLLEGRSK